MKRSVCSMLLGCFLASPLAAQSLGELAKQEEARRKAVTKPARVYTNEDLKSETPAEPTAAADAGKESAPATAVDSGQAKAGAAAPAAPKGGASAAPATPAAPPAADDKDKTDAKTEAYWRKRMTDARDAAARAQTLQDALQSRINALSTDFVNRDDPAQRQVIASDRQKALAELDRVKKELQQAQKSIGDIQEEARRAGVPPGWVR